jgi:hypothetical protein
MLDKGPNKIDAKALAAQPDVTKAAWDRYVREGVIEVAPWGEDDQRALDAPKLAAAPVNEIKLALPRANESRAAI